VVELLTSTAYTFFVLLILVVLLTRTAYTFFVLLIVVELLNQQNKESVNSAGQQFHQYQQNKESVSSAGQQFHQYQQNKRKCKQCWSTIPPISTKQKKV
jgi:formamidopyrimidine-DNA glycosylase